MSDIDPEQLDRFIKSMTDLTPVMEDFGEQMAKTDKNRSKAKKKGEGDNAFDRHIDSLNESSDEQEAFLDTTKELKKGWDALTKATSGIVSAFGNATSEILASGESFGMLRSFIDPVADLLGAAIKGVGEMIGGLTSFASQAGVAGKLLAGLGSAVKLVTGLAADAASALFKFGANLVLDGVEQLWNMFEGASSAGVLFANGLDEMDEQRGRLRLNTEEYLEVVKGSREQLTMFGGSVGEGAKRLAEVGKHSQQFNQELRGMGVTYKEQAENTIDFMSSLQRTGHLRAMSDEQIAIQSAEYSKNLAVMSAMTGKSVDQLKEERNEAMKNMAFQAKLAQMEPAVRIEMEKALAAVPVGMKQAFQESVIFGKVMTDTGAIVTGSAKYIEDYAAKLKAGGISQADAFQEFRENIKNAAPELRANLQKLAAAGMAELLGKGNSVTGGINDFSQGLYQLIASSLNTTEETVARQMTVGEQQTEATTKILKVLDMQRDMQDQVLQTIKDKAMPAVAALMDLTQKGLMLAVNGVIDTLNYITGTNGDKTTSGKLPPISETSADFMPEKDGASDLLFGAYDRVLGQYLTDDAEERVKLADHIQKMGEEAARKRNEINLAKYAQELETNINAIQPAVSKNSSLEQIMSVRNEAQKMGQDARFNGMEDGAEKWQVEAQRLQRQIERLEMEKIDQGPRDKEELAAANGKTRQQEQESMQVMITTLEKMLREQRKSNQIAVEK